LKSLNRKIIKVKQFKIKSVEIMKMMLILMELIVFLNFKNLSNTILNQTKLIKFYKSTNKMKKIIKNLGVS